MVTPILQELLGEGAIDDEFITGLVSRFDEDIHVENDVLERLLRLAFDELILGAEVNIEMDEDLSDEERKIAIDSAKSERRSRLIDAMESQAEAIEEELDEQLERLLDPPEKVAILTEFNGMVPVDPNALQMTRLSLEIIRDLFWDMGIPVREKLGMYSTQLEDAQQMVLDCLDALPEARMKRNENDQSLISKKELGLVERRDYVRYLKKAIGENSGGASVSDCCSSEHAW